MKKLALTCNSNGKGARTRIPCGEFLCDDILHTVCTNTNQLRKTCVYVLVIYCQDDRERVNSYSWLVRY